LVLRREDAKNYSEEDDCNYTVGDSDAS
jgi:hypothetical protein